jgi:hypothetical protein
MAREASTRAKGVAAREEVLSWSTGKQAKSKCTRNMRGENTDASGFRVSVVMEGISLEIGPHASCGCIPVFLVIKFGPSHHLQAWNSTEEKCDKRGTGKEKNCVQSTRHDFRTSNLLRYAQLACKVD